MTDLSELLERVTDVKADLQKFNDWLMGIRIPGHELTALSAGNAMLRAADIITELRSLRSHPATVRVKGLKWVAADKMGSFHAQCVLGGYSIEPNAKRNGRFYVSTFGGALVASNCSIDEAKAAAEADYHQRILSALEPQQEEAVAWRSRRKGTKGPWSLRYVEPEDAAQLLDIEPLYLHPTPVQKMPDTHPVVTSPTQVEGVDGGLLPCPFCGGEAKEPIKYNGTLETGCAGPHECPGTDVLAPVATWNRRAPTPPTSDVTVTDEMVEAAFDRWFLGEDVSDCTDEMKAEWRNDMRATLTAALHAKGGGK